MISRYLRCGGSLPKLTAVLVAATALVLSRAGVGPAEANLSPSGQQRAIVILFGFYGSRYGWANTTTNVCPTPYFIRLPRSPRWLSASAEARRHYQSLLFYAAGDPRIGSTMDQPPEGSLRQYLREISYFNSNTGLDLNGDVRGWFDSPRPFDVAPRCCDGHAPSATGGNYPVSYVDWSDDNGTVIRIRLKEMAQDAINEANGDVNYGDYDADNDGDVDLVIVVYAGEGWSASRGRPGYARIWKRYNTPTDHYPVGWGCGDPPSDWDTDGHCTWVNSNYQGQGSYNLTTNAAFFTNLNLSVDGKQIRNTVIVPEYAEIGALAKLIGRLWGWNDEQGNGNLMNWDMMSTGWDLDSGDSAPGGGSGIDYCGREAHYHPGDAGAGPLADSPQLGGDHPGHPACRWKIQAGWLNSSNGRLATPSDNGANLGIQRLASAQADITEPLAYRLWQNGNIGNEYFLLENREKGMGDFDNYLPGSGLLIYRVNNGNAPYPDRSFYRLLQADYNDSRFVPATDAWRGDLIINGIVRNAFHAFNLQPFWSRDHLDNDSFVRVMNVGNPGTTMRFDAYVDPVLVVIDGESLSPDYVAPDTPNVVMAKITLTAEGGDITIGTNPVHLNGGIGTADTTITVDETTGFPDTGYIKIDDELISYDSRTSTQFLGCQRAKYGTAATTHTDGTSVSNIDFFLDESGSDTTDTDVSRVYLVRDLNNNGKVDDGEWNDVNGNHLVENDEALADATVTQQTAALSLLDADPNSAGPQMLHLTAGQSAHLLVVYDVSSGASARVGQTLGTRILNNGYVRVAMPYAVSSSNLPFASSESIIATATLTVDSNPPAGQSIEQASSRNLIETLQFSAQNGDVDIASIRLDRQGTSTDDADISRIYVKLDGDNDGVVDDDATDPLITAQTYLTADVNAGDAALNVNSTDGFPSDGVVQIENEKIRYLAKTGTQFLQCQRGYDNTVDAGHSTGANVFDIGTTLQFANGRLTAPVPSGFDWYPGIDKDGDGDPVDNFIYHGIGNERRVFILMDVATTATVGKTVGVRMDGPNFIAADSQSRVRNTNFPHVSNLFTISDRPEELSVSGASLAPASASQGASGILMEKLVFSTTEDEITITGIKVNQDGTSTEDSDVTAVYLYHDTDQDGTVGGNDPQIGTTQTLVGGTATFDNLSFTVTSTASQTLLIVYDLDPAATAGATVTARLNSGDVTVQSPDTVASFASIESDECTIDDAADTLTVTGTSLASGSVQQGTASKVIAKLTFSADQDYVDVTRIRLNEGGDSTSDNDVTQVDLYLDENDNGTVEPNETRLATAPSGNQATAFANQTRTLTLDSDPNTVDDQPLRVYDTAPQSVLVVYTVSTTATVGKTLGVSLADASYVSVGAPDSVSASNLPFDSTTVTISDLPDTLTVSRTMDVQDTTVSRTAQKFRMAQLNFSVTAGGSGESVVVTAIKIDESGSSTVDTDVSLVRIIDDVDGDGVAGVTEPELGTGVFTNGTTTITLTSPLTVSEGTDRKVLITYDISNTATLGETLAASLVNNTYLTVSGNDVVSTNNFAISTGEAVIADTPDTLTVTGDSPGAATVTAGQSNVLVQRLNLTAGSGVVTVSSLTFKEDASSGGTDTGATENTDVSAVRLYDDVDGSKTLNTGDVLVGAGSFSSDATITLDADPDTSGTQPYQVQSGSPRTLLVVYDIAAGATAGDVLVNEIAAAAGVNVDAPDLVAGTYPIDSAGVTIQAGGDQLTIAAEDLAAAEVPQGTVDYPVLKLTLTATNPSSGDNSVTVSALRIDETGTNDVDGDISAVKVYVDNGNGTFSPAEDTLVGTGTLSSQTVDVALTLGGGVVVGTFGSKVLWVAYDIQVTAEVGTTVGAGINNTGYVTVTGNDTVSATNFPLVSGTSAITDAADTLTLTAADKAPTNVTQGQQDVVMLQLKVSASSDDVTLTDLKVQKSGTSAKSTDVTAVKVYDDANGDGQLQTGETLLGSGVFAGSPAITTVGGLNYTVTANTDRYLLLAYDISATAEEGKTVGATITDKTWVTVASPDQVSAANFPIASTEATIQSGQDVLSIGRRQPFVTPGTVAQGQLGVPIDELELTASSGSITVSSVTLYRGGTQDADADITGIYLYPDDNNNGQVDSGEDALGAKVTFQSGRATVNITGGLLVEAGTPKRVLIVYDIGSAATVGDSVGVDFASDSFVVASPDMVDSNDLPITGGTAQVVAVTDTLVVSGGMAAPSPQTASLVTALSATDGAAAPFQFDVDATAGFAGSGYLRIDDEIVAYDLVVDTDTFQIPAGGRGQFGTTAAAHNAGATVTQALSVVANQAQVGMQYVRLTAASGSIPVTSLKVDQPLSGVDRDVKQVEVWEDVNQDHQLDPGDTFLATAQMRQNAAVITFSPALTIDSTQPGREFLILYDVSLAADNHALAAAIGGPSYVGIDPTSGAVAAPFDAIGSRTAVIGNASQTLSVVGTPISPSGGTVNQGQQNVALLRLDFRCDGTVLDNVRISSLKLDKIGTSTKQSDIADVKLFLDDGDQTFGPGDIQIDDAATSTFSGTGNGSVVINIDEKGANSDDPGTDNDSSLEVYGTPGNQKSVFVVFDIANGAETGNTVGAEVFNAGYVTLADSDDVVAPFSSAIDSAEPTINQTQDLLTVTESYDAPAAPNNKIYQGQSNVLLYGVRLSASGGSIIVNSLRIDKTSASTLEDQYITEVKLFDDADQDGVIDPDESTPLAVGRFSSGTVTLSPAGYAVVGGTPRDVLVAIDLAAAAPVDRTLAVQIVDATYVSVQAPDLVQAFGAALSSHEQVVQAADGSLIVEPVMVTTPDPVYQSQADIPVLGLKFTASGNTVEVTRLTISLPPTVTGTSTDVAAGGVKVYRDGDLPAYQPNGVLDAHDPLINYGGTGADLGDVTLDTLSGGGADPLSVAPGTPETVFVTFDLATTATIGVTIAGNVASVSDVGVNTADVVQNVNFPVVGSSSTIDDEGDTLTVSSAGTVLPDTQVDKAAGITDTDTTIPVDSTAGFSATGLLRIDDEVIAYTGRTTGPPYEFTGCTRGQYGTVAAAHADNAVVQQAQAVQGETNIVVQWLKLEVTQGDAVTLTSLQVDETGTSFDSDIAGVRLYADLDGDGVIDASDPLLGGPQALSGGTTTFTNLSFDVTSADSAYLLVAVDVSGTAAPTRTIQTTVVSAAYLGLSGRDTVSTANLPLKGAIKTIAAAQDVLTVSLTSLAGATVYQGTGNWPMARLTLSANQGTFLPTSIKIKQSGTATAASDVEKVHLWLDVNNNSQVDFNVDVQQDGTGKAPDASGEATFALAGVEVTATTPKNFLVTYDIGLSATTTAGANTVQVELSDASFVQAGGKAVTGAFPLQSGSSTIQQGGDVLTVRRFDLQNAPAQAVQGQLLVPLMRLRLEASSGFILVQSIKLRRTSDDTDGEAGRDADTALLRVYLNPDQNDTVDAGDTLIVNDGHFATNIATLTPFDFDNKGYAGLEVANGNPRELLVVADISSTAKTGGVKDLGARIDDKSFVTVEQDGADGNEYFNDIVADLIDPVTSRDGVAIPSGAIVTNFSGDTEYLDLIAKAQTVTVAPTSASVATAGQQVVQGETNVGMLRLDLNVDADDATIDKVLVDLTGTGTRTDVSAVKLYQDNGDGVLETDTGGDTLLNLEGGGTTAQFVTGATATQATLDILQAEEPTVTLQQPVTLFVVYDVSSTAVIGNQLGASIARSASIVPRDAGDVVASTNLPLNSEVVTVAAGQELLVTSTDYAVGVTQGDTKAVLMGLTLEAPATNTADVTVETLKVNQSGTGSFGSEVSRVYVYEDRNVIGTFEDGVDQLVGDTGSGTLTPDAPTESVTITLDTSVDGSGQVGTAPIDPLKVAAGTKKRLLILYDIASKADISTTVAAEVPDQGIKVTAPGVVTGTFPMSTNPASIGDLPDLLTVTGTHLGPATATQGDTGVVMAKLTLAVRSADDFAVVTDIQVDLAGSAVDGDVSRVLLYDAGSNGTFDDPNDPATTTPDTLLAQGQFSGGTLTFSLLQTKQVVVTTTRELLVVFDIADDAIPGDTIAVSFPNETYFTVNAPDTVSPSTFPLPTTTTTSIVSKPVTLNVAGQNLAPASVQQGARAAFLSLSVWTQTGTCTLDSVKVKRTGAGTDADVAEVLLYADTGAAANQLDTGDTLLASGTLSGGEADLQMNPPQSTYPNGFVVTASQQRLLVVYDIAAGATAQADAVGAEVSDAAGVVASVNGTTVTTNNANFPIDSYNPNDPAKHTDIVDGPTTLTVEGYSVAPAEVAQGSSVAVLLLRFLKYGTVGETITSITVDKLGTATASNVSAVDLYDDTNHNGVFDSGDTKVNTTSGQFGSPAVIGGLSYAVNSSDGTFEQMFVVLTLASGANLGATIGAELTDNTFVTLQGKTAGEDVATENFPLKSSEATIVRSVRDLTVVGTDLAPPTVQPAVTNVTMLKLDLTAAKGDVTVSSLEVAQTGLAQLGSDFTSMALYLDDGDGAFDATKDAQLASRSTYTSGSTITFPLSSFVVQQNATRTLFVTLDIGSASQVTVGRTLKVQLANSAAVNVGPDQVLGTFPINSGTTTLQDDPPELVADDTVTPTTKVYNTRVEAVFSENVTGADVLSNFTLTVDGTDVLSTASPTPIITYDSTTFTTTISGLSLKTGADWTLTVGTGVQDLNPTPQSVTAPHNTDSGNVLSEFTPALKSATADNETLTVVFTVNMDETLVEDLENNWQLFSPSDAATPLSWTGATPTYASNSRTLRVTGLSLNTGETFKIVAGTALTDQYGNAMVANDPTYPNSKEGTVTGINPPTLVSAEATNSTVTVVFSEDVTGADQIDNYTLESPTGTKVVLTNVTVTYDSTTNTATLTGLAMKTGDTFKLTVSKVTDANNNVISAQANSATGTVKGEAPPTITASTADNNTVTVTYSKDVDEAKAEDKANYALESPFGTTVSLTDARITYENKVATITGVSLQTDAAYRITVTNVTDAFDTPMGTPNFSEGTVTGIDPPQVVSSSARTNQLVIKFSESVNGTDAQSISSYSIQSPVGTVIALSGAVATYSDSTKEVTLTGISLPAGKDYVVTVSNVHDLNNNVIDPNHDSSTGTVVVVLTAQGATTAAGYRGMDLVAVPMYLDDPRAAAVFGGTTTVDRWDGARQAYERFPQVNFNVVPGEGYWTHNANTTSIELGSGTLVPTDQPFRRTLGTPYDTVGNPFLTPIPWRLDTLKYNVNGGSDLPLSSLVNNAAAPVETYLWGWNTFQDEWVFVYDPAYLVAPPGSLFNDRLDVGEAAFALTTQAGVQLVLPAPSSRAASSGKAHRAKNRVQPSVSDWSFELIATTNGLKDRGTVVGVSSRAPLQVVGPPPRLAEGFVDLSLVGDGRAQYPRRLAMDIRHGLSGRASWDLLLTTDQQNAQVAISWPDLSIVPKQYRLRLIDLETGTVRALRTSSVLRLRTGRAPLTQRRLRLELVPANEGGVRLGNLTVEPARGRVGATVSFTLSVDAAVTVSLRSANGRLVQTVGPVPLRAGINRLTLAGRRAGGRIAPRGMYLLEATARTDEGEVFRAVRSVAIR